MEGSQRRRGRGALLALAAIGAGLAGAFGAAAEPAASEPPVIAAAATADPVVAAADARSSGLTLVGTVVSGGAPSALIKRADAARATRVLEGEALGSWVVEAIRRDSVVLSSGDRRLELRAEDPTAPGCAEDAGDA